MNKLIMGVALALICAGGASNPAMAEMSPEGCKGNACGDLSILWINNGFKFFNEGARPLRLGIRSGQPGNCGETRTTDLAPGDTAFYEPERFCGPVQANYRTGMTR